MKKILYLFIALLVVLVVVTGVTLARFQSSFAASDVAEIGSFIVNHNIDEILTINLSDIEPHVSKEYSFSVKNFNTNKRLMVKTDYSIEIIHDYDVLPLNFEIYKNNDLSTQLLINNKLSSQRLDVASNQTDNYLLKVTLTDDSYEYQDLVDVIKIRLVAEQVD